MTLQVYILNHVYLTRKQNLIQVIMICTHFAACSFFCSAGATELADFITIRMTIAIIIKFSIITAHTGPTNAAISPSEIESQQLEKQVLILN